MMPDFLTYHIPQMFAGSCFFGILAEVSPAMESDSRIASILIVLFIICIVMLVAIDVYSFKRRERNALMRIRQNVQTVLDSMPVPVRILDLEDDKIIYINKSACTMFGINDIERAYGQPIGRFMPPVQPDGADSIKKLRSLNQEKPVSDEIRILKENGEELDCLITSFIIDYHGTKASLGIMRNLSAEKEYRRVMENTAEKEKVANQLKGRFLVNMSHEIRTPMNAIIGLTEIELQKNHSPESRDVYKKISLSAKNLLEIVNDILDLSKIEADKIELFNDEFELEEVIGSALLVATPRLNEKNVEFLLNKSLELPRFVIGDRTRLWQVLKNFLDNSAKYTESGRIVVSVFENRRMSDDEKIYITFVIEDTGIGIEKNQMEKLFTPYKQVQNEAQKKYTGTGLGMVISKQLCEIMGGNMQMESTPGEGTAIFITIPFGRSKNGETGLQAIKADALTGVKILAVDDDAISLNIIARLLGGSNARYTLARSGEEALETVLLKHKTGERFDLILLDCMMKGLDGVETAKQMQAGLSKSPMLLMATSHQRTLLKQEQLKENGIGGIVEKPFIPTQFINRICAALGSKDTVGEENKSFTKFKDAHVLICEDYPLNQEVAAGMFEQLGVASTIAENGRQGVEILNDCQGEGIDLIFMDLQMPVMDGFEAAGIIRADPRFNHIPIISLTADAMKGVEEKCAEIGMNDHIVKPVEFKDFHYIFLKWLPESKRVREETVTLPAVDPLNAGLARFGGNRERYKRALLEFMQLLPEQWPDFNEAVQDIDETKRFIHTLKGAAGNLAEQNIYQCALEFEDSLESAAPDKDLYRLLISAGDDFKEKATAMSGGENETAAKVGTAGELHEKLETLKTALESYDLKQSTKACESLKAKSWPTADGEKLEQLYGFINAYDYDSALDVLESIKATPDL